mgnify:CR=1 FL=1
MKKTEIYVKRAKNLADEIDTLRLDLWKEIRDLEDKSELDDLLFSLQSKLRYHAVELIEIAL